MDKLEDELVKRIEPILNKYKDSILIDYRNFAAHDIAKLVVNYLFELAKESPTGTFTIDSHAVSIYKNIALHNVGG